MPYKSIEAAIDAKFPVTAEDIKLTLPQINKLAEFYDAIKAGSNVDDPFPVAWAAWKEVYKKVDNKWINQQEQQHSALNASPAKKHDVILQTLDTNLRNVFYAKEAFNASLDLWDGLPLVFSQNHPDFDDFIQNQPKALNDINGRIVGNISKPYINTTGHPRLMSELNITDPAIDSLIQNGKASVSTAFTYDMNKDNVLLSVKPNHVLIFQETRGQPPADRGSMIINKNEGVTPYLDTILAEVRSFFSGILTKVRDSELKVESNSDKEKEVLVKNKMDKLEEMAVELQNAKIDLAATNTRFEDLKTSTTETADGLNTQISDLATAKTALEGELKTASETITKFEKVNADALKARLDEQWDTLKKTSIPPGIVNKDEDEKALHTLFESNPHEFITHLISYNTEKETDVDGIAYNSEGDGSTIDQDVWNPDTGKFEVAK